MKVATAGVFTVLLAVVLIAGCSAPPEEQQRAPQKWQEVVLILESQPHQLTPGMNEFLVLATEERGRPVHDLIISLRSFEGQKWRQTIQDGHSGVYRRAIPVSLSTTDIAIMVRRKKDDNEAVLYFPVEVQE